MFSGRHIWESRAEGRTARSFYNQIAGVFSVDQAKLTPGADFTPGYRPGSLHTPLRYDRPQQRFRERFLRIVREGPQHYEFFGMKVRTPDTTGGRHRTWFTNPEVPEEPFSVPIFAKHKGTGRSMHVGWVGLQGADADTTLRGLLPKIAGLEQGQTFPLAVSGSRAGSWFYGQHKYSAAIRAYDPAALPGHGFRRVWSPRGATTWGIRNWQPLAIGGGAVVAGLYALNWLGQSHNDPKAITDPAYNPAVSSSTPADPWLTQPDSYAWQMAYGQAGLGQPLNEIQILNKPRHGDFASGSWLSGAWKRFRSHILPSKTGIEAMKRAGGSVARGGEGFAFNLPGADISSLDYRDLVSGVVGRYKGFIKGDSHARSALREELKDLRGAYGAFRGSFQYPAAPNEWNIPSTAFHELAEQSYFFKKSPGGRKTVQYGFLDTAEAPTFGKWSGHHQSLGVIKEELRGAELYDYVHGTDTLKQAIKNRRVELSKIHNRPAGSVLMGRGHRGVGNTTSRYVRYTEKMLDKYESGYSFVEEIKKGKGNVGSYFTPDSLQQLMTSSSAHKSGIRSQGARLANMPNAGVGVATPSVHVNKSRCVGC